jgi:hypothetical protein
VNIADPKPPIPRRTNKWKKSVEAPAKPVVIATITNPLVRTTRSPVFSIRKPEIGAEISRVRAKNETIVLAAKALTPNDLAKSGIAGANIPNPSATEKAITDSTQIAGGKSRRLPGDLGLVDNYGFRLMP